MNDPHVETLHYRLVTSERVTFNDPPPLTAERNGFDLALNDGESVYVTPRDMKIFNSDTSFVENYVI
jgi:hypothetical protein